MAYRRFLTDEDYISLLTEEHMKQIIREKHDRLVQAEQRAEMTMLEYLDQYYEIERLFAVGKNIGEYNPAISYPAQAYFRKDEKIYKTLTYINGYKKPTLKSYWQQVNDFIDPASLDRAQRYSQLRTYAQGEIVKFGTEYWRCLIPHGFDSNEIHMPGCVCWVKVDAVNWEPNIEWNLYQVCEYNGSFYMLTTLPEDVEDGEEGGEDIAPDENPNWSMIGDYDIGYEYNFEEGSHDYVVNEGAVFVAITNPNPVSIVENENVVLDDPRNINVVAHMTHIAVWYALQLISPTNISESKRWAFEDSMGWLSAASKFKINPQLPRKRERCEGVPKVDWALATFQRSYNPNENPWLI